MQIRLTLGLVVLALTVATGVIGRAVDAAPGKKRSGAPRPGAVKVAPKASSAPAPSPPSIKPVQAAPVWSVAFSPDGKTIGVGGYKRVALYSAETGTPLAVWLVAGKAVRGLAFSPDGKYLAAGGGVPGNGGNVTVFDTETGKPARIVTSHHDTVEAAAFAGPSLLLSAANDEKVRITDLATGQPVGTLSEHVGRCLSLAAPRQTSEADGGDIFVTGGADNVVKVWDAKSRRVVVNFDQCQGPVWSIAPLPRASGQPALSARFVVACADGRLRIFGVRPDPDAKAGEGARTGFLARNVASHEGGVYAVAASPDGKWIASGGGDKKLIVWSQELNRVREMTEAAGDVFAVAILPDSRLVAAGSMDGKTRVYTLSDGKLVWELPGAATPSPAAPGTVNGPTLRSTAR